MYIWKTKKKYWQIQQLDEEEDSDDDYSGKSFDRESPRDDNMDITMNTPGFDVDSMQNARM